MWFWPQRDMAVQNPGSILERMALWRGEEMGAKVNQGGNLLLEYLK